MSLKVRLESNGGQKLATIKIICENTGIGLKEAKELVEGVPCIIPYDFSVEEGSGPVLLGEVSQCNDDNTDNRFNPPVGRFPVIEEDEPPYRLLCNEYPVAK